MSKFPLNNEQEKAKTTIDTNVSVSAGAGSGKTRVLTERYLYILEQGRNKVPELKASQILAITFTRKAAGEMRQRVREAMEAQAGDSFWRKQLEDLDRAQICTIDSLCSRILRDNPVEANLDPGFAILDEFDGGKFLLDAMGEYIADALQNKDSYVRKLIEIYGLNAFIEQLQILLPDAEKIAQEQDLLTDYQNADQELKRITIQFCDNVQELAGRCEQYRDKRGKYSDKGEKLALLRDHYTEVCERIENHADFCLLNQYLANMRNDKKIEDVLPIVKEQQEILAMVHASKEALNLDILPAWLRVLQDMAEYIHQRKLEKDVLTFSDQEKMALDLLKANANVRKKYQERYRYIMVDEFQDTNERQKELIYLLCGDSEKDLQGKKLFIVGDPKQSIYRFRGADVGVFAQARRDIAAVGGENLSLNTNYRSTDKILDAVNKVFEELLGTDTKQDVYFEALKHNQQGSMVPHLTLISYDKNVDLYSKYVEEAKVLAQLIKDCHDGKTHESEAAGDVIPYGKMAILLRSHTHSAEIIAALQEHGIPYVLIDGRGFYDCQEVLDLLNLFKALRNRYANIELAGVLRSVYFGLDDETLTRLFLQGEPSLWDALMEPQGSFGQGQDENVQRAQVILRALRQAASALALPELWQEVWQTLKVEAVLMQQEHGANQLANVGQLRSWAQTFCAQRGEDLGAWLDYVTEWRATDQRATTANLDEQDAVQILTIHKSKGLEFHTVFLPYLEACLHSNQSSIKYIPGQGLGIKVPDYTGTLVKTTVLDNLQKEDKSLDLEERKRLLYVAMTRAEKRLELTAIKPKKAIDDAKPLAELSWAKQIRSICANAQELQISEWRDIGKSSTQSAASASADIAASTPQVGDLCRPLPSYACSGRTQFSPSMLQQYLHCQRQYFYQYVAGLPTVEPDVTGAGQLAPKDLGVLAHRALELYQGNAAAAVAQAVQELRPGTPQNEILQLVQLYVESNLYKNLPQNNRRELHFSLQHKEFIINGIVDFLGMDNGKLVIVDYKTGRPPQAAAPNDGYMYQLALYKAAMEQLHPGKTVQSVELHYLQNLSKFALRQDRNYLQEALNLCEEMYQKKNEEDYSCVAQLVPATTACQYCPYEYLCKKA